MSTPAPSAGGQSYFGVQPTHLVNAINSGAQSFDLTQMGGQAQQAHTSSGSSSWMGNATPEQLQTLADQVFRFSSSSFNSYRGANPVPSAVVYAAPFPYDGQKVVPNTPINPPRADQTNNDNHAQASGFDWFQNKALTEVNSQINAMVAAKGGTKNEQVAALLLTGGTAGLAGMGAMGSARLYVDNNGNYVSGPNEAPEAAEAAEADAYGAEVDASVSYAEPANIGADGRVIDESAEVSEVPVEAGTEVGTEAIEVGAEEVVEEVALTGAEILLASLGAL